MSEMEGTKAFMHTAQEDALDTTAMPGSLAILHKASSGPAGRVEALLQIHPGNAAWKGWAGKAGPLHLHRELVPAAPWHIPLCSLCPTPQHLETPCLKHQAPKKLINPYFSCFLELPSKQKLLKAIVLWISSDSWKKKTQDDTKHLPEKDSIFCIVRNVTGQTSPLPPPPCLTHALKQTLHFAG